ncbi:hypothetical protein [Methylobacterium sp. Leaf118]|uniref:hypothetical protein n=1 Tax=Methylobacterium sp. Leaf118 TaxID=2876562 RepID=UPI001E49386A|nr:hypothetical protein [Methylobacterium sp. Leaf118]
MGASTASRHVGQRACQTNYYTTQQAARLGFPLSHFVTINFAHTVVDPRAAVACFSVLRRNDFNKWATRPGKGSGPAFPPTYAYAFENARDGMAFETIEPGDDHNVHVHWSVHIPAARAFDFQHQLFRWVEVRAGGVLDPARVIDIRPISTGMGGYLIKGARAAVLKIYGRGQEPEPQGIIIGRRADTSRNLGPTARRRLDVELGIRRQMPNREMKRPENRVTL